MEPRMYPLFVILSCVSSIVTASQVPICARNTYHFSDCIMNATDILRPRLAQGIPELNIPAFDPLKVPQIHLQQLSSGVNYRNSLTDAKIYGLTNYKFNTVRADVTKGRIEGNVELPWLRIESRYNISGTVVSTPIEGSGFFNVNITDSKADISMKGRVVERRGIKYYNNTNTELKLSIGGVMMSYENLHKTHPNTTMATSMFLNENSSEMMKDLKPALETIAGLLVNDVANSLFRSQPYDRLFPKI